MTIQIQQKEPPSFGIKVAIAVIIIAFALGKISHSIKVSKTKMLAPALFLSVDDQSLEKEWVKALSKKLGGDIEVTIERGRVDVMTKDYAIEVDFLKKWKEGFGQAVYYGEVANKISVLALIVNNNIEIKDKKLLKAIEKICIKKGVKLIILKSKK